MTRAPASLTKLPPALFQTPLPGLGRPLVTREGDQLCNYLNILIKWQSSHRLVGSIDPSWLIDEVIVGSIAFLAHLPPDARRVADLGSGAGIPGVPIAVVRPDLEVTLLEIRRRRVSFLSTVVRELGSSNVTVAAVRVEEFAAAHPDSYDAAVMRCAGRLDAMLPGALKLVRPRGVVLMTASPDARDDDVVVTTLPGRGRRHFRVVRKP